MVNGALSHDTVATNRLIMEKDLSKSTWCRKELETALEEIHLLSTKDRDAAVLKVSCLYGRVRLELKEDDTLKKKPLGDYLSLIQKAIKAIISE